MTWHDQFHYDAHYTISFELDGGITARMSPARAAHIELDNRSSEIYGSYDSDYVLYVFYPEYRYIEYFFLSIKH